MHDIAPAFSVCNISKIQHQSSFNELFGLATMVELCGAHRVATNIFAKGKGKSLLTRVRIVAVRGKSNGASIWKLRFLPALMTECE